MHASKSFLLKVSSTFGRFWGLIVDYVAKTPLGSEKPPLRPPRRKYACRAGIQGGLTSPRKRRIEVQRGFLPLDDSMTGGDDLSDKGIGVFEILPGKRAGFDAQVDSPR